LQVTKGQGVEGKASGFRGQGKCQPFLGQGSDLFCSRAALEVEDSDY